MHEGSRSECEVVVYHKFINDKSRYIIEWWSNGGNRRTKREKST
jgi:hypothetical protein